MAVTEDVLTVLIDVEGTLHQFAEPNPDISVEVREKSPFDVDSNIVQWTDDPANKGQQMNDIAGLLEAMYGVNFLATAGQTVGSVLDRVANILVEIAEKLQVIGAIGTGTAELSDVLDALRKIPGSDEELDKAAEILEQIVDLLDDVPSARAELYMIAQQIRKVSDLFENPTAVKLAAN